MAVIRGLFLLDALDSPRRVLKLRGEADEPVITSLIKEGCIEKR